MRRTLIFLPALVLFISLSFPVSAVELPTTDSVEINAAATVEAVGGIPAPPADFLARDKEYDNGKTILISWKLSADEAPDGSVSVTGYKIERAESHDGPWIVLDSVLCGETLYYDVAAGGGNSEIPPFERGKSYYYRIMTMAGETASEPVVFGPVIPKASWIDPKKIVIYVFIIIILWSMLWFMKQCERGRKFFVRKIPGLAAVEEALGRATELGRPVLYVPGIEDIESIQTICSITILSEVAERVAKLKLKLLVPLRMPFVVPVAEDTVRQGYINADRVEDFDKNNIQFLTDDQFAYAGGVCGIMARERPAAVFLLGGFFAESLILAETGAWIGAIQVAGTASIHQIPFFVTACDYTLIGEELYAGSAYLSQEPSLMGMLKASDLTKAVILALIVLATGLLTIGGLLDWEWVKWIPWLFETTVR